MAKRTNGKNASARERTRRRGTAEGPPADLIVTHKPLDVEMRRMIDYVNSVKEIIHSSASSAQIDNIDKLVADLQAASIRVLAIRCPNPMFSIIAVDSQRLSEISH